MEPVVNGLVAGAASAEEWRRTGSLRPHLAAQPSLALYRSVMSLCDLLLNLGALSFSEQRAQRKVVAVTVLEDAGDEP